MPIAILCGACDARLNAPDAAAGKKVKCPKCGVLLEIPRPEAEADFEVVEEAPTMMMPPVKKAPSLPPKPAAKAPPPPAVAKAKPKPVVLDEDKDEDDRPVPKKKSKPVVEVDEDDDDRPTPKMKGKKKPAAKDNTKLLIGVGGGVFTLALVGFLVYWFALREPEVTKAPITNPNPPGDPGVRPGPQPGGPPAGWTEFTGEGFAIFVPQGVDFRRNVQAEEALAAGAPGSKVWMNTSPPLVFQVMMVKLPPADAARFDQNPDAALTEMAKGLKAGQPPDSQIESDIPVLIDGQKGRQLVFRIPNKADTITRTTVRGGYLVNHTIGGQNLPSDTDARVKPFFDGFRFTDAGQPPKAGGVGAEVPKREPSKPKPATGMWKNYSGKDFDAWIPAEAMPPAVEEIQQGNTPGTGYKMQLPSCRIGVIALRLSQEDWAAYLKSSDSFLNDRATEIAGNQPKESTVATNPVTIDKHPARELYIKDRDVLRSVNVIVVADRKAYIMYIGSPKELRRETVDNIVKPFFDNFIPKP